MGESDLPNIKPPQEGRVRSVHKNTMFIPLIILIVLMAIGVFWFMMWFASQDVVAPTTPPEVQQVAQPLLSQTVAEDCWDLPAYLLACVEYACVFEDGNQVVERRVTRGDDECFYDQVQLRGDSLYCVLTPDQQEGLSGVMFSLLRDMPGFLMTVPFDENTGAEQFVQVPRDQYFAHLVSEGACSNSRI